MIGQLWEWLTDEAAQDWGLLDPYSEHTSSRLVRIATFTEVLTWIAERQAAERQARPQERGDA